MVVKEPDLPLRLAAPDEPGSRPFYDYLRDRADGDRRLAERLRIFIEQWDVTSDRLQRRPTVSDYAEMWGMPEQTAYRQAAEFKRVFPTEDDPARLLNLLWSGTGTGPRHLFSVDVVHVVPEFQEHRPTPR